jgi:hypothetical protein
MATVVGVDQLCLTGLMRKDRCGMDEGVDADWPSEHVDSMFLLSDDRALVGGVSGCVCLIFKRRTVSLLSVCMHMTVSTVWP